MNKYPIWWNTTVTIYNKFIDPLTQVVTWYKTKVTNAFWKDTHNKVKLGGTVLESDSIVCRIREDSRFMEKPLWDAATALVKAGHFTLAQADIIIRGEATDTVDEYTKGKRSTDLLDKYKGTRECFEVQTCSNNTGIGLGSPHYMARGV